MKSDSYFENMYGEIDGESSEDCVGILSDMYSHAYSQAEERLTTDVVFIPNANRYIRCVDIYVRRTCSGYQPTWESHFICIRSVMMTGGDCPDTEVLSKAEYSPALL